MKELIIKILYDDENCYKGHGDDTEEILLNTIKTNIEMDLVDDDVIKDNWSIEILNKI
jgi:hypothetical protein